MKIPNNPMKAYLMGKRHGCQETFDMISMVLLDKCGWHTFSDGTEDRMNIEYMFHQVEDYADSINKGYMKRKDIKQVLLDEAGIRFVDNGVE